MRLPFLDYPWLLILAALLPLVIAFLFRLGVRKRRERLSRLGSADIVARLVPPAATRSSAWRAPLLGGAALCAGLALAGPRWGMERTIVRGEGIDLVLALDASLSMMATDDRPSRLERMKQEVRRLLDMSRADRVGLIAFAGRSYILTPLTIDAGAIDLYLDNLDPGVVGQAGSSLARAVRQGVALLRATNSESDRALVVMSDGEAFEPQEDVVEAARLAAEAGITVITVGFGTPRGSPIPLRAGDSTALKTDESGNVVITRYTPELLQLAATESRGVFIDAATTDKAGRIRQALSSLRTQQRAASAGRERRPQFQLFLIPALLLLVIDTILAERRGRRRRAPAATVPPAAAAALLLLLVVPSRARADVVGDAARAYAEKRYAESARLYRQAIERGDRRPVVLYNYGTALLAMDSLARAAEVLQRATDSLARASGADVEELRYRALFNLGLAHLRRGLAAQGDSANAPLDAALAAYKRALLMRSSELDAKWNYELALRKRRGGGGGGGGGGGASSSAPSQQRQQTPQPRPSGGLGQQQAEQILNSAAREEREVQARRQGQTQAAPPPGGKDW
jgi:Ca-activated chloride channel family protein